MKRIAVIALVSYLAFALEFLLYNFWGEWGRWFKPELLVLVVIFFNLYLGIRFSIIAAIFCGVFKDASGIAPFGTYIMVYITAAYATTLVRKYIYQPGSRFSRAVVTLLVLVCCFIVQAVLSNMSRDVRLGQVLLYVLLPQIVTTMIAATYVFSQLRNISVFFALKD